VYDDNAPDPASGEAALMQSLDAVGQEIQRWRQVADPINKQLNLLHNVKNELVTDRAVQDLMQQRIESADSELRELFNCPHSIVEAPILAGATASEEDPTDPEEYARLVRYLETALDGIDNAIDKKQQILHTQQTNLYDLEFKEAQYGALDRPLSLKSAIDSTREAVVKHQAELDNLHAQRELKAQQLHRLGHKGAPEAQKAPPTSPDVAESTSATVAVPSGAAPPDPQVMKERLIYSLQQLQREAARRKKELQAEKRRQKQLKLELATQLLSPTSKILRVELNNIQARIDRLDYDIALIKERQASVNKQLAELEQRAIQG
jgi:hypothetical protein